MSEWARPLFVQYVLHILICVCQCGCHSQGWQTFLHLNDSINFTSRAVCLLLDKCRIQREWWGLHIQRGTSCALSAAFINLPNRTLQVFSDVAYKAKDRNDLIAGIDEFLDQVTVLPPGEWDPSIRIEPPKNVPSQVSKNGVRGSPYFAVVWFSLKRNLTCCLLFCIVLFNRRIERNVKFYQMD